MENVMSKVEIIGQLVHKSDVQAVSDKFKKQEAVICISSGKYEDYIKFEAVNDVIQQLESCKILSEVILEGYLSGRKYTDAKGETRYFTNVRMRSIKPAISAVEIMPTAIEEVPW